MSLFRFLKGAPKVTDDLLDKDNGLVAQAGAWIGNFSYTDEEQAEHRLELAKGVREFVVQTLEENTDRSRARREIAVFFIKFYAMMLFMCGMTYPVNSDWSMTWFNLATSLSVGGLVSSISIFFFGSHVMRSLKKPES